MFDKEKIYYVLIARIDRIDEIHCKNELTKLVIDEKQKIYKCIRDTCSYLQLKYQADIASPFTLNDCFFSAFGETEVLLHSPNNIENIKNEIFHKWHNLSDVTIGIGEGNLFLFNPLNCNECDGPAFWKARENFNENVKLKYKRK
jgi:hypothetical protein